MERNLVNCINFWWLQGFLRNYVMAMGEADLVKTVVFIIHYTTPSYSSGPLPVISTKSAHLWHVESHLWHVISPFITGKPLNSCRCTVSQRLRAPLQLLQCFSLRAQKSQRSAMPGPGGQEGASTWCAGVAPYCRCRNYRTEVEEYEGTVIYRTLLFYNSVFLGRCEKKTYLNLLLIFFVVL